MNSFWFLRRFVILLLRVLLYLLVSSYLSFKSTMKYSQIIAALNLPQIYNEILCIVDVSDVLCNEVFVDFFC